MPRSHTTREKQSKALGELRELIQAGYAGRSVGLISPRSGTCGSSAAIQSIILVAIYTMFPDKTFNWPVLDLSIRLDFILSHSSGVSLAFVLLTDKYE
jgi:hypothetical protein